MKNRVCTDRGAAAHHPGFTWEIWALPRSWGPPYCLHRTLPWPRAALSGFVHCHPRANARTLLGLEHSEAGANSTQEDTLFSWP